MTELLNAFVYLWAAMIVVGGILFVWVSVKERGKTVVAYCEDCGSLEESSLDEPSPDMQCECGEVRTLFLKGGR